MSLTTFQITVTVSADVPDKTTSMDRINTIRKLQYLEQNIKVMANAFVERAWEDAGVEVLITDGDDSVKLNP